MCSIGEGKALDGKAPSKELGARPDAIVKARYFELACEILLRVKDPCTIRHRDAAILRDR